MKISFCMACMNRFFQIQHTLIQNLKDNEKDKDKVDFVLVDFNSTDGLKDFVLKNCKKELEEGYLKYYFTEELKNWDGPIAKNTPHRLAEGDILVNLDCDNYTGYRGGKVLLDLYKSNDRNVFIHQGQGIFGKGNTGRVSYYREDFMRLGGHNEDFLPMGHLDVDVIDRFVADGIKKISLPDERYNKAIKNTKEDTIRYCDSEYSWRQMVSFNVMLSRQNIKKNKLVANKGETIGVTKNVIRMK